MKRSIIYPLAVLCLLAKPSLGQETYGMTFAEFMAKAENDTFLQEQTASILEMMDINSDNKISFNEINNISSFGKELDEKSTNNGMDNRKEEVLAAFKQSDKNNDNELSADEIESFIPQMRYYLLKKSFNNMDRNKDGVYNKDDMPTLEESNRLMEESIQKMDEAVEKMKNMDSEAIAQNWMTSVTSAIADEDYYQMDKNHDNCVTKAEYEAYGALDNNPQTYEKYYKNIDYKMIKKEKRECLTKEEMITFLTQPFYASDKWKENAISAIAEESFYQMDKNQDGCVTEAEYDENKLQDEYFANLDFTKIEKERTDCLTKEEMINYFNKVLYEEDSEENDKKVWEEEYIQMDKNQDACVTGDEFIEYNQKEDEDSDTKMTYMGYKHMYIDIKKENKNCLTKEEYIKDKEILWEKMLKNPSQVTKEEKDPEKEKEYAEALFEYMDKDSNGKLTAEEYAEYQYQEDLRLFAPNTPTFKKADYSERFFTIIAPNKGWLSKDEFVEDYIK